MVMYFFIFVWEANHHLRSLLKGEGKRKATREKNDTRVRLTEWLLYEKLISVFLL